MNKPTVDVNLSYGENAWLIMGQFQESALNQGWSQEQIEVLMDDAMSGNYVYLCNTLRKNTNEG